MHPGTTASLICPACGQAFLSMQQGMEGMVQCPHCAHNAPRMQFATHAQVAGVAQVRRRVAQTQPMQELTAPAYQPPPLWTAPPSPAPSQPQMASIARATLQPSQALMPTGEPPPHADFTMPPQAGGGKRWLLLIMPVLVAICAMFAWFWWGHGSAPAVETRPAVAPEPAPVQIRKAGLATKSEPMADVFERPDELAIAADAKALVTELFAADTAERRAACIHEASRHADEIESLFGAEVMPRLELRLLARLPGLPRMLPGGRPVLLFKLLTSRCPQGALVRLETGADGRRRIDWPLLFETHEAKLTRLIEANDSEITTWIHVGLRPSHGLDIPAELRPKYLTFDLQVSASSVPHYVACVERDTPLGRFLDRESEWGKAYLARFLVRKLDIAGDAPCVLVLDCEGAKEGGDGR